MDQDQGMISAEWKDLGHSLVKWYQPKRPLFDLNKQALKRERVRGHVNYFIFFRVVCFRSLHSLLLPLEKVFFGLFSTRSRRFSNFHAHNTILF